MFVGRIKSLFGMKTQSVDNVVGILSNMIPQLEELSAKHADNVVTYEVTITKLQAKVALENKEQTRANSIKAKLTSLLE